ncbi:ABC transporter ATP-binding protein [Calidithermus chliarophilus]|uniref:ABC transporter ATP-binding protein n=1 Tax=Calidithermus chliarophilus TaxID=52023 RepID=UPI0004200CE0|nr:ABC transporter ATP-binding protein [Calidithermus chliarophilus]
MIELTDVTRDYPMRRRTVRALGPLSLRVGRGEFWAIQGRSGSGKSTLLNLIGLLDEATAGEYRLEGTPVTGLSDTQKSRLRARTFGFLFQSFRLVQGKTVLENVLLPMEIARLEADPRAREERALHLLEQVGLADRAAHLPAELSGGEAQRVAFARALANGPQVLLADEPTGNLDPINRDRVLGLIHAFHSQGTTVVLVTHDPEVARGAQRHLRLERGQVAEG